MEYQNALNFLFSQLPMFSRVGAAAYKPGLETSLNLDKHFGHPHRKFKSIHVAGTNGKGSTSHMLASVLQAQGYKVGLYTSPHLADFRERMRINGEMIPTCKVVDFVERWKNTDYDGHPSFFELTMMMAFDWFASENVDYAVIEVGMGGRLDSTNIITPIGSVITNISFDHTQFLGDTLEKIAAEKSGIIKKDIPVVIGHAEGGVRKVFQDKADEVGAPIIFAEDNPLLTLAEITPDFTFACQSPLGNFQSPLSGDYQRENINTALHAIEMLRNQDIEIGKDALLKGLETVVSSTGLAGRWMITDRRPLTICDTGHNQAGLSYTMPRLETLLDNARKENPAAQLRIVIGFVNDKDVAHIVELLPKDASYYVTQASVPRALPANDLLPILQRAGLKCTLFPEGVTSAYESAQADSALDDIIFIGGSTFIVADYLAQKTE